MIRWSERDELEELGRENPLSTPGVAWHAQSCPTLCDSVDCSPPGSFVHGIFKTRILERVAISYSRGDLPDPEIEPVSCISYIAGGFFTTESPENLHFYLYFPLLLASSHQNDDQRVLQLRL